MAFSVERGIYGGCVSVISEKIAKEIPELQRYARALTRERTAAEDLVQDCVVRALAKQHLWREGSNLRAWLFTILRNEYVSQRRRLGSGSAAMSREMALSAAVPKSPQEAYMALLDLDGALNKLSLEQRMVVLMVGLDGLSQESVARVLGVSIGTVWSRLSRGRNALRCLMDGVPAGAAAGQAADL